MNEVTLNALRVIGELLDQGRTPSVFNGGVVMPGGAAGTETAGKESSYEFRARKRRPTTRSRRGAARRKGKASGSRAASSAAPPVGRGLASQFQADLVALSEAYPGFEVWYQHEGMWLRVESALLPGLDSGAAFLIYLPYNPSLRVTSWAFWITTKGPIWIGPRHTNFPDGSICAFHPKHNIWKPEVGIVNLIDLYTIWAIRQIYLKEFNRWPGGQYAPHPYERRKEFQDDEWCGCEKPRGRYFECCKSSDYKQDFVDLMLDFMAKHAGGRDREPPEPVTEFVTGRTKRPPVISQTPVEAASPSRG